MVLLLTGGRRYSAIPGIRQRQSISAFDESPNRWQILIYLPQLTLNITYAGHAGNVCLPAP